MESENSINSNASSEGTSSFHNSLMLTATCASLFFVRLLFGRHGQIICLAFSRQDTPISHSLDSHFTYLQLSPPSHKHNYSAASAVLLIVTILFEIMSAMVASNTPSNGPQYAVAASTLASFANVPLTLPDQHRYIMSWRSADGSLRSRRPPWTTSYPNNGGSFLTFLTLLITITMLVLPLGSVIC